MPWTNAHLKWLVKTRKVLRTSNGKPVEIWEFQHKDELVVLSAWAKHFRNHYCLDTEIDFLRAGYNCSRKEYLNSIKFPDRSAGFGPAIRAGDLAEILVADYLQYILGFWVPRTRYADKAIRNESTKGADVLGFLILKEDLISKGDTLFLFEVKAQLSGTKAKPRLQDAVDGSAQDHLRKAEALNAVKQRLFDKQNFVDANKIDRFQNPEDHPYKEKFGAAAVFCNSAYSKATEAKTDTSKHPFAKNLSLVVICGDAMMDLVHSLYQRAADEA